MTAVQAISAASTATETGVPKSSAGSLDYSAFLQLLIAQLKNQDPTKPMDSTQFVAQLATFSQVEQSVASNAKLDSLLTSSALSLADAVIGRTVTSADGTVTGKVVSVIITSEGPIATLENGDMIALAAGVILS